MMHPLTPVRTATITAVAANCISILFASVDSLHQMEPLGHLILIKVDEDLRSPLVSAVRFNSAQHVLRGLRHD